jgi:hypothetical protein
VGIATFDHRAVFLMLGRSWIEPERLS